MTYKIIDNYVSWDGGAKKIPNKYCGTLSEKNAFAVGYLINWGTKSPLINALRAEYVKDSKLATALLASENISHFSHFYSQPRVMQPKEREKSIREYVRGEKNSLVSTISTPPQRYTLVNGWPSVACGMAIGFGLSDELAPEKLPQRRFRKI